MALPVFAQEAKMPEPNIPGLLLTDPPVKPKTIVFYDAKGEQRSLRDFRGKVVLVNLWATWCVPCIKEMPSLDRLQTQMGENFQVVAISQDKEDGAAVRFFEKMKLKNLAVYTDPQNIAMRFWNVPGLPASFVINQNGEQVGSLYGTTQWDNPAALNFFRNLLPETAKLQHTGG